MKYIKGFTLIELMVTIVILAILAAIAIPMYQQYLLRSDLAVAKQVSLNIANELERFKSKNYSYKGFNPDYIYPGYNSILGTLLLPVGSTNSNAKYTLTLVELTSKKPLTIQSSGGIETADSKQVRGLNWAIKVERMKVSSDTNAQPKEPKNYDLLLKSDGMRCMTTSNNAVKDFVSCGTTTDVEKW
ncbi:type IV pilin protein [uncultured Acinetobacter sp.]|uniref:type IV pilin protein n=1 Tax=uncultured Acinetobacter sp. TaxID=165433 RepID=UPI0025DF7626|nr:prepilin-type N-terminal cleavage/methylation domain-containing protein [uncultured Acinetobacter sp.]